MADYNHSGILGTINANSNFHKSMLQIRIKKKDNETATNGKKLILPTPHSYIHHQIHILPILCQSQCTRLVIS